MIRASIYILMAGLIWMAEGFIFSEFLSFAVWQTVAMVLVYAALFALAVRFLLSMVEGQSQEPAALAHWRYLALAPQVTVVVGSFLSLPVLIAILAIGKAIP